MPFQLMKQRKEIILFPFKTLILFCLAAVEKFAAAFFTPNLPQVDNICKYDQDKTSYNRILGSYPPLF